MVPSSHKLLLGILTVLRGFSKGRVGKQNQENGALDGCIGGKCKRLFPTEVTSCRAAQKLWHA